jgi:glycerol kinase
MQFQADVLGVPVSVPEVAETTALGAALLAAVGTGICTLDDVRTGGEPKATYDPVMSEDEREELLDGWHHALERAKDWEPHGNDG